MHQGQSVFKGVLVYRTTRVHSKCLNGSKPCWSSKGVDYAGVQQLLLGLPMCLNDAQSLNKQHWVQSVLQYVPSKHITWWWCSIKTDLVDTLMFSL